METHPNKRQKIENTSLCSLPLILSDDVPNSLSGFMFAVTNGGDIERMKSLLCSKRAIQDKIASKFLDAAGACNKYVLEVLLANGCDPNVQSVKNCNTPLNVVAQKHDLACLNLLLHNHADPNIPNAFKMTPLLSVFHPNSGLLGDSPHVVECVQALLQHNADPNLQDKDGKTALMWAVEKGRTICLKLLIENGADPNLQDKYGKTALMFAAQKGHTTCLEALLSKGANPNLQENNGRTALMYATGWGKTDCLKALLENGADPNLQKNDGMTVLMLAVESGKTDCLEALLANNADPNLQDQDGRTTLMVAASKGHTTCLQALLSKGADPNLQNKYGRTALMIVVKTDDLFDPFHTPFTTYKILKILIENHADPHLVDENGNTAFLYAEGNHCSQAIIRNSTFKVQLIDCALRWFWRTDGDTYQNYLKTGNPRPPNLPMLNTILKTRTFTEELMQRVWAPNGRMFSFFMEEDDV